MTNRLNAQPIPRWLAKRVPFTRYRVAIDGHNVHVMETGSGPTVLCVHGNPTWGYLYRKVAVRLAALGYRVVMPDLIGLGFSDRVDAIEHTLVNHRKWMAKTIDALGLENYIVVGQDWGGPIGFLGTADAKNQPDGVVILNTVCGPPKEGFKQTTFHKFAHSPAADFVFRKLSFPQNILTMTQGNKLSIVGADAMAYTFPLRNRRTNSAPLALARMVPNTQQHPSIADLKDCETYLKNLDVPKAIVWGKRDPILGGVISHTRRQFPDARVTLTNAGHFLQEEVPDQIVDAVVAVHQSC